MRTITSIRDYRIFLKDQSTGVLESVKVLIPKGSVWDFSGIKWVNSLTVEEDYSPRNTQNSLTSLSFPDLKLINGDFNTLTPGSVSIYLPQLEEIRGELIRPHYIDDLYGISDFSCINGVHKVHFPSTCTTVVKSRNSINLANDKQYILKYNKVVKCFYAGCLCFTTVDEAITHWTKRFEYATAGHGWESGSTANRALMFVFALTNFKEELRHAGLL